MKAANKDERAWICGVRLKSEAKHATNMALTKAQWNISLFLGDMEIKRLFNRQSAHEHF